LLAYLIGYYEKNALKKLRKSKNIDDFKEYMDNPDDKEVSNKRLFSEENVNNYSDKHFVFTKKK